MDNNTVQKKDGSGTILKRVVHFIDTNKHVMPMQVFAENIETVQCIEVGIVVGLQNLTINVYNGEKYLVFNSNSAIEMDVDDIVCVETMKSNMLMDENNDENCDFLNLEAAINKFVGTAFSFMLRCKINDIDISGVYKSCPDENCKKKVTRSADGSFKCDKCSKSYATYMNHALLKVRFIFNDEKTY